ncbi:hypothetical protein L6250_03415 [Candidatus Parcubacteria bacterium]|nr:hypothetical protein [Candidatus Parcubacteria bacterium]
MKLISNKKTFLVLILLLGAIIFGPKSVSAQAEITICPLSKMVTVGSLLDQSFVSVSNLLLEVDKVLYNSAQAHQTATRLIQISNEDCKPVNCQSDCDLIDENQCDDNAPSSCSTGYSCIYSSCHQNSGSGSIPKTDCTRLTSGTTTIGAGKFYYNATWCLSACYSSINNSCSSFCSQRGICSVGWNKTIKVCDTNKDCEGEACPFALITSLVQSITANRMAVETAHKNIEDFFEKDRTKFPKPDTFTIFGDFCKHPIISKHCFCAAGLGVCGSEFDALMILQREAINNIKKCDILKPDDLFKGKQGEILFRCKDVRPSPVKQCWQDDFFCCTSEE